LVALRSIFQVVQAREKVDNYCAFCCLSINENRKVSENFCFEINTKSAEGTLK
jgi:hypothetical protein